MLVEQANVLCKLARLFRVVVVQGEKCIMSLKCMRKHPFWAFHVIYFIVLSGIGASSLWLAPKAQALPFIDALYNAVSAITETGLASVPMHRFALSDQITLLLLMLLGAQVFTSAIPLFLRRLVRRTDEAIPQKRSDCESPTPPHVNNGALRCSSSDKTESAFVVPEDPSQRTVMEYEALTIMSWLTICYYVFCISTGFLICQISVVCSPHASAVLMENRVNSVLFSIFATVSAYGNCGYILLDENMVPLQRSWVTLLCLSVLMLMGNTLYAPAMRLWIWILHKRAKGDREQVYAYILGSYDRHFTHIFPSDETWWLVSCVVFWNACQVMCMLGIDWRSEALVGLGAGYKVVVALFQSIAARTGGMNAVNLSGFSVPTLFVALVAMYVASYPIHVIKKPTRKSEGNVFVAQLWTLRRKDSFLFVAIFLVCFFERGSLRDDPLNFSFFNIIYEILSAYGNVGLTIGYNCSLKMIMPHTSKCMDSPCAFSGKWSINGKVVLIVVMLFGRHRNLLEDIDWDIVFQDNKGYIPSSTKTTS